MKIREKPLYKLLMLITAVFVFLSSFMFPVFAANTEETTGPGYVDLNPDADEEFASNPIKRMAIRMANTVYGGQYGMMEELRSLAEMVPSEIRAEGNIPGQNQDEDIDEAVSGAWKLAQAVYKKISPIGQGFVMLFFLIDIIEKTTKDQLTPEIFVRAFIKLLVAVLLITNGLAIVKGAFALVYWIGELVGIGAVTDGTASNEVLNEIKYDLENFGGTLLAFGYIMELIAPWIGVLGCSIYIKVILWARILELFLRIAVAPIGMADMFSSGFSSSGFRYFKKIVALLLQGIIIIIILYLCGSIQAAFHQSSGFEFVPRLIMLCTEVALIKKSQSYANELLGV